MSAAVHCHPDEERDALLNEVAFYAEALDECLLAITEPVRDALAWAEAILERPGFAADAELALARETLTRLLAFYQNHQGPAPAGPQAGDGR